VQELVRDLLEALEAQERAADHQQRRDRPRRHALMASAAGTRITLFTSEPLATAHTTGSSRSALHARDLLGVEREVVAQHAGRLLGGDLGHHRDVVEDRGDVVDQREQAGSGQRAGRGRRAERRPDRTAAP
jgi:hypothetical protein